MWRGNNYDFEDVKLSIHNHEFRLIFLLKKNLSNNKLFRELLNGCSVQTRFCRIFGHALHFNGETFPNSYA